MRNKLYFLALLIAVSGGLAIIAGLLQVKSNSGLYRIPSGNFKNTLLIPNPEIEHIYLYLVFPSGEAANPFDEGMAHYVEHLAWLSFLDGSNDNEERHSNAWTNRFSTGYWQIATKDDLHTALQRLIEVSKPLSVDSSFALEERNIILREYDYRVSERPLYPVYRDMDRILYGNGSLARSVIGEPPIIAEYSLDDARTLHRQSHVLREVTLLVYGNVDKSQLETALAALPMEQKAKPELNSVSKGWVEDGTLNDKASLVIPDVSTETFLYRKLVPLASCDAAVLSHCAMISQIAENALDSALPGGLAGPLRFDRFVARSFSFNISIVKNAYVEISFTAYPDNGVSLEELELAFHDSYRMALQNGLTPETFERVQSRLSDELHGILVRDRPRYNRDLVLGQLTSTQPIFSLSDQMKVLESIRFEDVNRFLRSLLADGREVTRLVAAER